MSPTDTAELNARRAALALDVAEKVPGASEALTEVEDALRSAALDEERAAIAEEERVRRDAVLAQRRAEAARAEAQEKLPSLAKQSAAAGDRIDRALADLRSAIVDFRALDKELRDTGRASGVLHMSDVRSVRLKDRLLGEVASAFPGNIDYRFANPTGETFGQAHRRSLGHLLDDEAPGPADEPEPAEDDLDDRVIS